MAVQPVMAAEIKCDQASMKKMNTEIEAMSASSMKAQKNEAMMHLDLAKDSMKANKMDDCKMHMGQAMKAMKKT